jgi:hypothetical protein
LRKSPCKEMWIQNQSSTINEIFQISWH